MARTLVEWRRRGVRRRAARRAGRRSEDKTLHAKIGELTLENDFLERALAKDEWAAPRASVFPHLLRGRGITRPNQVWAMNNTYIPMPRGFLFLAAVMDWASRPVLSWRASVTLSADCCVEVVEEAIARHGRPEIFNTDQGARFMSDAFTGMLHAHGIAISMDGKGCWRDNIFVERFWRSIKYEEICLHAYASVSEAKQASLATSPNSTLYDRTRVLPRFVKGLRKL